MHTHTHFSRESTSEGFEYVFTLYFTDRESFRITGDDFQTTLGLYSDFFVPFEHRVLFIDFKAYSAALIEGQEATVLDFRKGA